LEQTSFLSLKGQGSRFRFFFWPNCFSCCDCMSLLSNCVFLTASQPPGRAHEWVAQNRFFEFVGPGDPWCEIFLEMWRSEMTIVVILVLRSLKLDRQKIREVALKVFGRRFFFTRVHFRWPGVQKKFRVKIAFE
jgi:hypothetical protein